MPVPRKGAHEITTERGALASKVFRILLPGPKLTKKADLSFLEKSALLLTSYPYGQSRPHRVRSRITIRLYVVELAVPPE